ncbi:hypothetical protein pp309_000028 [Proteus phage 309]|uniref:Uncharacterized protein n=1 Tax=Proteus phage 309 TaxID=2894355 RepID=A0AAE8YHT3_9CAUD|nr:hypothetical protein pp309_000028 [Proteus phage 309]
MSDLNPVAINVYHDVKDHKLILDICCCTTPQNKITFIRKPMDKSEVQDLIKDLYSIMKQM